MNEQRALVGDVMPDFDSRSRVAELERTVRDLRRELSEARSETTRAVADATRALSGLRRQLSPLYRALQDVFGELDSAGVGDTTQPQDSRTSAVWASWKQRLGGSCAKVIDALMLHNELNTQQIAINTGLHRTTVPKLIYELNKAGLINKNGGRFSLKSLS